LQQRVAAAERIGRALTKIRDPIEFGLIAKRSAERLGLDESVFRELRAGAARSAAIAEPTLPTPERVVRREELLLLQVAFADRTAAVAIEARSVLPKLHDADVRRGIETVIAAWQRWGAPESAVDTLPDDLRGQLVGEALLHSQTTPDQRLQIAEDCCRRIEDRAAALQRNRIKGRLREADAEDNQMETRRYAEALDALLRPGRSSDEIS
jgi:hypothetical protein